jgi:hypothetical protein
VTSLVPAEDDDGFDTAGVLVDVVALTDSDPLFLGLAEDDDLAEGEEEPGADVEEEAEEDATDDAGEAAVDAATCVAAGVVQVGFGVAPTPFLPGPAELVLVL